IAKETASTLDAAVLHEVQSQAVVENRANADVTAADHHDIDEAFEAGARGERVDDQHEHHDHFAEEIRDHADCAPWPDRKRGGREHDSPKCDDGAELERELGDRKTAIE